MYNSSEKVACPCVQNDASLTKLTRLRQMLHVVSSTQGKIPIAKSLIDYWKASKNICKNFVNRKQIFTLYNDCFKCIQSMSLYSACRIKEFLTANIKIYSKLFLSTNIFAMFCAYYSHQALDKNDGRGAIPSREDEIYDGIPPEHFIQRTVTS